MEALIILLLAAPLVLAGWLIVRAVSAGQRIDELKGRVNRLEFALGRLQTILDRQAATRAKQESEPHPAPAPAAPSAPEVIPAMEPPVPPPAPVPEPQSEPLVPPLIAPLPASVPIPATVFQTVATPPETPPALPEAPPVERLAPAPSPAPAEERDSFEMKLGTYWLVRVGVVMLLTGLAFFGNYAYHHIIGALGPVGKISLLYLFSGGLLGAGAWWQRRTARESLKNYAQVLFAGGLAAVYFTTYAAHHIPPLQVIGSATLDGSLLMLWAGVIGWIADRRRSEVMALFGIGLAFYSSIITRVGDFTLYSNLVLTLAAVGFLLRNRWAGLSFAGLAASYAGYSFWRFLHDDGWRWAAPDERLNYGAAFLAAYWLVFTAAAFLSRSEKLTGRNRAAFVTLNNGAFFTLFLLSMLEVRTGGFWKFSLGFGAVLLGLAGLARRRLAGEKAAAEAYLTQGLLLVTLGFILKFSGLQLALVLGTESVALFLAGAQRSSRLLQGFGAAVALLATGWGLAGLRKFDPEGLWTGAALGGLMTVCATRAGRAPDGAGTIPLMRPIRWLPAGFTLLAGANWLAATWFNTSADHLPPVLTAEAVALTCSIYLLRVPEITLLGQLVLIFAQVAALDRLSDNGPLPPWWSPLAVILGTLGLSHWWSRQRRLDADGKLNLGCQSVFAVGLVAVVLAWTHPLMDAPAWLALTAVLALGATLYGVATRVWPLAVFGQIFLLASLWQFAMQVWTRKPEWYFPLVPVAVLAMLAGATGAWLRRRPETDTTVSRPVLEIARVYWWLALALSLCWLWQYVPEREHVWVFMAASALLFAAAEWRRNAGALAGAGVFAVTALIALWTGNGLAMNLYWPDLAALLGLFAMQQVLRRRPANAAVAEELHAAVVGVAGLSLWRWISCWAATLSAGDFVLTITWAGLALGLFLAGMGVRERWLRWSGLFLLAAAAGRVVLVDVWKQETIYRVLTFMALGAALVVIGFLYNRYQDKFREWL